MTIKEIKKIAQTATFFLNQHNYNVLRENTESAREYLIRYDAIVFSLNTDFGYTVEKVRFGYLVAGIIITSKRGKCLWASCLTYDNNLDNMCKERMKDFLTEYGYYEAVNIYDK